MNLSSFLKAHHDYIMRFSFRYYIIHKPWLLCALFGIVWLIFCILGKVTGSFIILDALNIIYGLGFGLSLLLASRTVWLTKKLDINLPCRILILAPHQDDCVFSAGGVAAKNHSIGGVVKILYLAIDQWQQAVRCQEAVSAWELAGVSKENLEFYDLLPLMGHIDKDRVACAAIFLQNQINNFYPDYIIVPAFEGGHIHHDITNALVRYGIKIPNTCKVLEAMEYTPYLSLWNTPHQCLSQLSRFFLGRFPYMPLPDGINGKPVFVFKMNKEQLKLKENMLAQFKSQGMSGRHLVYEDRFHAFDGRERLATPFNYERSVASLMATLVGKLGEKTACRILPLRYKTIGLTKGITNIVDHTPCHWFK